MSEDERAAAAAAQDDPAALARRWLATTRNGALATLSADAAIEGYPFGSVVPFTTTAEGAPVVLLAEIAAHTKNLKRDPRASLLVQEPRVDGDPQAGWRVTVVGTMKRLVEEGAKDRRPEDEAWSARALDELHARYRAFVPAADDYRATHGFSYWRLDAAKVRFIGGFGKICWLDAAALRVDPRLEGAEGAIAHMNEDHEDAMKDLARGFYGTTPSTAKMTLLQRQGFLVETTGPDRLLWFAFDAPIEPPAIRKAVVALVAEARARTGAPR